jgi:hypothetical protein
MTIWLIISEIAFWYSLPSAEAQEGSAESTSATRNAFSFDFSFLPVGSLPRNPIAAFDFWRADGLGASALAAEAKAIWSVRAKAEITSKAKKVTTYKLRLYPRLYSGIR